MLRSFHKYLSLAISIQLLLWTVSGIFFAFNKIELIRGEQYLVSQQTSEVDLSNLTNTFNAKRIEILQRLDILIVKVEGESGTYYTDKNGIKLKYLNEEEAKQIVRNKTSLIPIEATKIENPARASEFRGRSLPLFKVTTQSKDHVNVYVNAVSGEVSAIRSNAWRTWDFLWGAHIIDYAERENIDNFLLKIFSILALISSLSGILLFFTSLRKANNPKKN